MSILVLADTHLDDRRAETLVDILGDRLDRADAIIHAGDITGSDVLQVLERFAPVTVVAGNNDDAIGVELPERIETEIDGVLIGVVHDSGPATGRDRRLATQFPLADVVVFGHSHLPWNQNVSVAGRIQVHFNPGSPTQRRRAPTRTVGWIDIDADGVRCRHEDV